MTSKAQLHESLAALRAQIDQLDEGDAVARERLQALLQQMEREIEAEVNAPDQSLKDAMLEIIEAYEIQHPRITAIVNDIMTKLMSMGI